MSFIRLPINSLSGGVGRQAPTKRLISEAENIDNCLVTVEKSVEKRPPLSRVVLSGTTSSYLNIPNVTPPTTYIPQGGGAPAQFNFNNDNLYFHFLDVDGFNRYCIVINRTNIPFDPVGYSSFDTTYNGQPTSINLGNFIKVYRIEPTEWIEESVDSSGTINNTSGFDRGVYEYLTFGNKNQTFAYRMAGSVINGIPATSIQDTFGSIDYNVGIILWNKLVPLDFMPDNSGLDMAGATNANWYTGITNDDYIHSGDVINYKISTQPATKIPSTEDTIIIANPDNGYWTNVRDDINFEIDVNTLEEEETGQSLENFSFIPQYPASEVYNDVTDLNGYKALRMLNHYYDNPRIIPPTAGVIDFTKDHYHRTSPLPAESRDAVNDTAKGFGKVYFARNPYLTFPAGFYRATRYSKNPYFERVRSEGPNSVLDHRRFPLIIYKDFSDLGKWKVSYLPMFPRRSGTSLSNPGPKALERKEKIQSMAIWKNRLWIATENTIFSSRTNSFFNFWFDDVSNIVETDPIDLQSSVGAYNKYSHLVPFQSILFAGSSGSTQFEVRGGSIDTGISPFNVELRATSFFSTAKLTAPLRMGNNIFFMDASKVYMYVSGSSFNDEYSTSMDMSQHCKGYLPNEFGPATPSSALNTLFFRDKNIDNYIYLYTMRTNGDRLIQNAFSRWILSSADNVLAMKSYEKDLYIVSKRNAPNNAAFNTFTDYVNVYYTQLEAVPITTPMLDWLTSIDASSPVVSYVSGSNSTVIILPHYDDEVDYVVLGSEWGSNAYTAIPVASNQRGKYFDAGVVKTTVTIPGNYTSVTAKTLWVGHSYTMNVELSTMVPRNEDGSTVFEGVLNLKRITTRHLYSGNYDIVVTRNNRSPSSTTTFYPFDLNNIVTTTNQLKIDTVGEHFARLLSYSEKCKIQIQSAYPTPCNISNIEILGNYRKGNTSIE